MSNPANRASDSSSKPRKKSSSVDLATARQMLPLIRSIVSDIVRVRHELTHLTKEQHSLDRNKRQLDWNERSRRYVVHEQVALAEKNFTTAMSELGELGVTLIDPDRGAVDFPTRINGRPAAFSWLLGEEAVAHWHYEEEDIRRPIPHDWQPGTALRSRSEA